MRPIWRTAGDHVPLSEPRWPRSATSGVDTWATVAIVILLCLVTVRSAAATEVLDEVTFTRLIDRYVEIPGIGTALVELRSQFGDVLLLRVISVDGAETTMLFDGDFKPVLPSVIPLSDGTGSLETNGVWLLDTDGEIVVFVHADSAGGWGLYRYTRSSGALQRIADTSTPMPHDNTTFASFGRPWLDRETVVFGATSSSGVRGFYRWDGSITTIVDTSSPIPGGAGTFTFFRHVVLDDGILAFNGLGADQQTGVYRVADTVSRVADRNTLVPGTADTFEYFSEVAVHEGTVFFKGYGGFVAGIYGGVDAAISVAADTMMAPGAITPFDLSEARGPVYVFDDGDLYFRGGSNDTYGIYVAHGGAVFKVIDSDENEAGIPVGYLQLPFVARTSQNRIYFEGDDGIYRADLVFGPAPAPQPGIVLGFEGLDLAEGDAVTGLPGLGLLNIAGAMLVEPGPPEVALPGDDAGTGAMLTAATPAGGVMSFTFAESVQNLSLQLAKIEPPWSEPEHPVELRVFDAEDGGNLLETIIARRGETGIGVVNTVDFSTGFAGADRIRRLEIRGPVVSGTPGYAIDNLAFASSALTVGSAPRSAVVPVPTVYILLGGMVLAALGWGALSRPHGTP